jgi:hypothetical protein
VLICKILIGIVIRILILLGNLNGLMCARCRREGMIIPIRKTKSIINESNISGTVHKYELEKVDELQTLNSFLYCMPCDQGLQVFSKYQEIINDYMNNINGDNDDDDNTLNLSDKQIFHLQCWTITLLVLIVGVTTRKFQENKISNV